MTDCYLAKNAYLETTSELTRDTQYSNTQYSNTQYIHNIFSGIDRCIHILIKLCKWM